MCGIAGLFSFENFKKTEDIKGICDNMLLDIEIRGNQATGIAVINTNTNEIKIFKKPTNATEFIKEKRYKNLFKNIGKYNLILLHTRYSTNGNPIFNKNNHPFYDKQNNNTLIHNGVVWNYEELRDNANLNLKLNSDCDSEVILSLFNKNKYDLPATLKQLEGSFAIGLYNLNKLYLYSNSNPIYLCYNKTKEFFLFSSHKNIFKELFNQNNGYTEYYNLFKIPHDNGINNDEMSIIKLDDEDLIKINFKRLAINKTTAKIKPYEYKYEYKKATAEDIATQNFLIKYEDKYFKELEKEDNEFNKEYISYDYENTNNIHRQPLHENLNLSDITDVLRN